MNNLPKHHGAGPQRCGAPKGAGPPAVRSPMQLHRLKAGPVRICVSVHKFLCDNHRVQPEVQFPLKNAPLLIFL